MAKLGGLINGQDVAFDTHQAGDGQNTNWEKVHLEKRLHNNGGKARFPLLGNEVPSNSGMNNDDFKRVTKEVKRELGRNKPLLKKLANAIVTALKRFSTGKATSEDAKEAAKRFADYFDLDTNFLEIVEEYAADNRLSSFTTIHFNRAKQTFHEIHQSKEEIVVQKSRRSVSSPVEFIRMTHE